MERFFKNYLVPFVFVAIKLLTAVQTAKDTYAVTHDWLKVILIDGAFLALWLYLAYAGQSQQDRRNRVYASVVAMLLYTLMIGIGWEASPDLASIGVRVAGGAVLVWDVYRFISQEIAIWISNRKARREERRKVENMYRRQMSGLVRTGVLIARIRLVKQVSNEVYTELQKRVPDYVRVQSANVIEGHAVETPPKVSAKTTRTVKRRSSRIDTDRLPERIAEKIAEHPDKSNREIAKMLKVSESTLYKYMPGPATNGNGHREVE
jgi:hypothetical protein